MQQVVQKESHKAVQTIYVNEKTNTCMIYYVVKRMEALLLTVSSFSRTSLSHCFSPLSTFLYSKPCQKN